MFVCPFCTDFCAKTYGSVLNHVEEMHQYDPNFQICCHFCPQTFTKVSGYKSHLYRKHNGTEHDVEGGPTSNSSGEEDGSLFSNSGAGNIGDSNTDVTATSGLCSTYSEAERQQRAALFILKAKEERMLTQNALDGVLKDVTGLIQYRVRCIQEQVQQALTEAHVDATCIPGLDELFSSSSALQPFSGLETEYLQMKYFRENLRLLEPVERVLGQQLQPSSSGSHHTTFDCCYDIPFLQSLQLLLRNVNVQQQVFNSHKSHDNRLRDYCDGKQFAMHPLFSNEPCALQIQLYYDDIDVCNPIGSKSVIHKLGLFYYCLGNIDPKLRSRLQSILLLAVVETSLIAKYGIDVILEPFVEEMMQLESVDGVPFEINCQTRYLRGTLTSVPADNPASNLMGGYKNLSSAFRKCRDCLATGEEIQTKFTAEEFTPRTKAVHERHCSSLCGPLHDTLATTYGVNRDSILNKLSYFHVTSGLPPDVMHDIFEGVAVVEVKCMLLVFIREMNLFTLPTLNSRIKSFPYGYPDSKNKPQPLPTHILSNSGTEALKQSSSQTWCLIRLLPLIIGDLIPEDNPHWRNFLVLLTIVDYVCAPETTIGIAGYLRDLIKEHHIHFKQLYPHRPLTPKFHYMVHMPQWIVELGPLVRMWCMRYEAKHRYFKRWASIMGNFKNIPKTLALHHQRHLCYQLAESGGKSSYLSPTISAGPATLCDLDTLVYKEQLRECCPSLTLGTSIHRINWVEIMGTIYKPTVVVLVCFQCDVPIFGQIKEILSVEGKFYLALQLLETEVFNSHFHAYEVKSTSSMYVCGLKSLEDHHPLWVYQCYSQQLSGSCFVPLKYYVLSNTD